MTDEQPKGIAAAHAVWLTRFAWVLAVGVVLARVTVSESVRDVLQVVPLGPENVAAPRGVHASVTAVLNFIACLPALLVLTRRVLDPTYVLRPTLGVLLAVPLVAWTCLSVGWSDDKLVAASESAHWVAAAALLFAVNQLVRTWLRFRQAAAVGIAVLFVLCVRGVQFQVDELPAVQEQFAQQRAQFLAAQGLEPDSPQAEAYERRINSGAPQGFSTSPNTFGATLVLGCIIAGGLALQRFKDKDASGLAALPLLAIPVALWLLYLTSSKAGFGGLIFGAIGLAAVWQFAPRWSKQHGTAFTVGLVVFALATVAGLALLAAGLVPIPSLAFRWNYWVGSAGAFAQVPIFGTGFGNFGDAWLVHRPANAAEEIRDPHNTLVRFAVELGIVGGVLALAWFGRLAWETTRSAAAPTGSGTPRSFASFFLIAPALAFLISFVAVVDLRMPFDYVLLTTANRAIFFAALVIGLIVGAVLAVDKIDADNRPAPLLAGGVAVAVGVFFVQSLLDVALFEPGSLFVWVLLVGALVGVRTPSVAGKPMRTMAALGFTGLAYLLLIAAGIAYVFPIVHGQWHADIADGMVREGRFDAAVPEYDHAFDVMPVGDPDLLIRKGNALIYAGRDPVLVMDTLDRAIAERGEKFGYYQRRAELERRMSEPQVVRIIADLTRAVELNPQEIRIRLDLADELRAFGDNAGAIEQYEAVLEINEQYDDAEPERLGQDRVAEINARITELTENTAD
ncbi:MAG: O-antigen ligase family protein [Planctomycetota bacterium]